MSALNKFFGGLKKAGVAASGNYFPCESGQYKLEIERFFFKSDRNDCFIAELNVVESSNPNVKVGERRSWVQTLKEIEAAQRDVNSFVLAAIGVNPKDKGQVERYIERAEEIVQFAISEANPFHGAPIDLETFKMITKRNRTDFTKHIWYPSEASTGPESWIAKLGKVSAQPARTGAADPNAPFQVNGKWFVMVNGAPQALPM